MGGDGEMEMNTLEKYKLVWLGKLQVYNVVSFQVYVSTDPVR